MREGTGTMYTISEEMKTKYEDPNDLKAGWSTR
jgi:hypothetical protein